jgi:hypothetical protein
LKIMYRRISKKYYYTIIIKNIFNIRNIFKPPSGGLGGSNSIDVCCDYTGGTGGSSSDNELLQIAAHFFVCFIPEPIVYYLERKNIMHYNNIFSLTLNVY